MTGPVLVPFDDEIARGWEPFALTRPCSELLFGAVTLRERAERGFGIPAAGVLSAPHLREFEDPGAPAVLPPRALPQGTPVVTWCVRAVLDADVPVSLPDPPALLTVQGQPAGWYAAPDAPPPQRFFAELHTGTAPARRAELPGRWLEHVWQLVTLGPEQLARDLAAALRGCHTPTLPPGVDVVGDHPVELGRGVQLEPHVVFDTRNGPVWLGDRVQVRAFTRIEGPAAIRANSRVLGGSITAVSTGEHSYLHGEIAETTVLGYTNKAHDGYLGHAYVGRWVNLGAMTTNSDLKNTYGTVRVWTPQGERDTGALKVGAFIGDHVKTGIGLLLATGAVIGAGSNLFGSAMPPRTVPPFSWGEGGNLTEHRLEEFLTTAERMMARRGVALGERGRRCLEACWRLGRSTSP